MLEKYPKFVLLLVLFCLIGAGAFYFSNTGQESETQTQTVQNLKLLNSHSHPEAGDEWVVSFETRGPANLTITPTDPDTVDDLDFVSLSCDGKEKTEEEPLQILAEDAIFYPDWQCDGTGKVIHLVNIARKHTLKFQFSNKIAFAYNNPDSVTDTFDDESKIASKENITVSGSQVYLATCGDNGDACSAGGDCCSNYCVDDVCCNTTCTGSTCQRCDSYSNNGTGTCGYVNSSSEDPDSECPGGFGTCAATTCSGSGYSCGYLTGQQGCVTCTYCTGSNYNCSNYAIDSQPSGCTGCNYCNGAGSCKSCSWSYQSSISDRLTFGDLETCKPSDNNASRYFAATGPACSASGYTVAKYLPEMTVHHYKCICQ